MKKNIVLVGLLMILSMIFGGIITFVFMNSDYQESNDNTVNDDSLEVKDDELKFDDEEQEIISSLRDYGKEIYANGKYLNFDKDDQGVYYASINDLMNLGYDTSIVDKDCNTYEPIIYFDVDNIMNDEYYGYEPLVYIINCGKKVGD